MPSFNSSNVIALAALAVSLFSIYSQVNEQSTTDAVIKELEVSSEPGTWRVDLSSAFINRGNRQSLVSNVGVLYAHPDRFLGERCSRDGEYKYMKPISVRSTFGSDAGAPQLVVPTSGVLPAAYRFEAQKEILDDNLALPYEICIEYAAVGGNGELFIERRYAGSYLIFNDRTEVTESQARLQEPTRLVPKRTFIDFIKDIF